MRKLISANFSRLWKDKIFWLTFAFAATGSSVFSWMSYITAMKNADLQFYVEDMTFNMLPMTGFICALFISMRLGTEFDEHTIRNKLIIGYTRAQVYFAEYVTCMTASLLLLFTMLFSSSLSGYILFREFLLGWMEFGFLIVCCVLITAVFSALAVGFGMNVRGKAYALVASILFLFAILLLASFCINALEAEPTTFSYVSITMDGIEYGDVIDNPAYIDGFQRTIYELIADLLPTGQTIQLNNLAYERASRWPYLSAIVLVISTLVGFFPFRKRDIR